MPHKEDQSASAFHAHCCPCEHHAHTELSRRHFLGGVGSVAALSGMALTGLSWSVLAAEQADGDLPPKRRPLVVKPVLVYELPTRRPQTSWRNWGGIETKEDVANELAQIQSELNQLQSTADFPVTFLPIASGQSIQELTPAKDEMLKADVVLLYASGGAQREMIDIARYGKNTIVFCRHTSGQVYLWYECASPIMLREFTDKVRRQGLEPADVVIDSQPELLWRLRALCGLCNTRGARILAVGGPAGWGDWEKKKDEKKAPQLAREGFQLDIQTVSYDELGRLLQEAFADPAAVERARRRADAYLKLPGTTLEVDRQFVDNALVLEDVFRALMRKAGCRAITINSCMSTVMPVSRTTACLPLSILNDDGYLAFCESDFVVIPAGMLLANISGKPQFLNDPTYPHDGVITLAHCTGPRKMDGRTVEPARILTHFESDYGAAPKVAMRKGQVVTNLVPAFDADRWLGLRGEIIDAPFLPICRDQIDIRFQCDSLKLAERMPGFHWITCYGDYLKEVGYALKRVGISWANLG